MKTTSSILFFAAALCLVLSGPGCIMEDRVVEVVVTGETCAVFTENHGSEQYTTPVVVDFASRIDEVLEDNDLDRSDITSAKVMSASYEVTDFSHDHDWSISGYITVERLGEGVPEKIIEYTEQSLMAAQAAPVGASLDADGVALVNQALQDYLDGDYPMLRLEVNNGSVEPAPNADDRLVFTWEACMKIHVLYEEEVDVPDPL
jgi:hypothetical protein